MLRIYCHRISVVCQNLLEMKTNKCTQRSLFNYFSTVPASSPEGKKEHKETKNVQKLPRVSPVKSKSVKREEKAVKKTLKKDIKPKTSTKAVAPTSLVKSPLKAKQNVEDITEDVKIHPKRKRSSPVKPLVPRAQNENKDLQSPKKLKSSPSRLVAKASVPTPEEILDSEDDFFGVDLVDEVTPENFNLKSSQRCQVLSVQQCANRDLILRLKILGSSVEGTCVVKDPWSQCAIQEGDFVSVNGKLLNGMWTVDQHSCLALHSDLLITGTNIVGSLFCKRRTVLNSLYKDIDKGDTHIMVVGNFVHELLQTVLMSKIRSESEINQLIDKLINSKDFIQRVYVEGMNLEKTVEDVKYFARRIHEFVTNYVAPVNHLRELKADDWRGEISSVPDIEENIWAPSLGIKGKIDATVRVNGSTLVPLELKTGKASNSAEHRGQVILYTMLLSQLGHQVDSGLLLYLKEGSMKEVKACGAAKNGLLMTRNDLAHWMLECRKAEAVGPPLLPPPINHRSACLKCPKVRICSAALKENGLSNLPDANPLKNVAVKVTEHLSKEHIDYVFHWTRLMLLESRREVIPVWSLSPEEREDKNIGIVNLNIAGAGKLNIGKFGFKLHKTDGSSIKQGVLIPGQYVTVSNNSQIALATGFVDAIDTHDISVSVDRNLSSIEGPFHLDKHGSDAQLPITLGNLTLLLEDTRRAAALRNSIIDLKLPSFMPKLPSKIKNIGKHIFMKLNEAQNRALLQALSSESYILIEGMPGAGKTTTIRSLIELLVLLKQSVLVTSHTHSAVDNILVGLIDKVDMLRLGSVNRVHPKLVPYTEQELISNIKGPLSIDKLNELYTSKPVIGVTCLGTGHFLFSKRKFDVCIVDEATQVWQPEILGALYAAKNFILVGDPKQLPPLVVDKRAKDEGLGVSMFERLNRPAVKTVLSLQYRMNGPINQLANDLTYGGELKCGTSEIKNATLRYEGDPRPESPPWLLKALSKKLKDSIIVINVPCKEDSLTDDQNKNEQEAQVILKILEELHHLNIQSERIGVISPYRGQVELIKRLSSSVLDPEVNTVDQFQGRDKEIVIFSTVRTSPSTSQTDNLADVPRLNVAITRSKVKLIIVGNVNVLNQYDNFKKLFKHIPPSNFVDYSG